MGNPDCLYLCNSAQNNKSAIAYYKKVLPSAGDDAELPFGGNVGAQPDDLVYVSNGFDQVWEGGPQSFTFPNSGVTLTINIPTSAQQTPVGGIVSGATASNGFETFQVLKMNGSQLVVDGDGVELNMIYILI